MKKTALLLVLIVIFSIPLLADDGGVPIGTKTCPEGQTCLTVNQPKPTDKANSVLSVIAESVARLMLGLG